MCVIELQFWVPLVPEVKVEEACCKRPSKLIKHPGVLNSIRTREVRQQSVDLQEGHNTRQYVSHSFPSENVLVDRTGRE